MTIKYTTNVTTIIPEMLQGGFFVGWPNPPSSVAHLRILQGSYIAWVAIDTSANKVAGFINAVSDGVMAAYIPLLEVLPEYQKKGVGKELTSRMLESLKNLYMVDLLCDEDMQQYYTKFGMRKTTGVFARNYERQSCGSYLILLAVTLQKYAM